VHGRRGVDASPLSVVDVEQVVAWGQC
jgi:hypothetical protein